MRHAVHLDVVRIFAVTEHFGTDVHAERPLSDAVGVAAFRRRINLRLSPENRRRQPDAVNDLPVAGASAEIAPDRVPDLLFRGIRVFIDQRLAGHHHARGAETALDGPAGAEGIDKRFFLEVRQAFHRLDRFPRRLRGGQDAGFRRFSVNDYGTGSAGALAAPVLHGIQVQVIPQVPQQRFVLRRFAQYPVYRKLIYFRHNCPSVILNCLIIMNYEL